MKPFPSSRPQPQAFTLLEMSIVILMLMALMTMGIMTSRGMDDWKLARKASESLRNVYTAQRMYLADHPTRPVSELTAEMILPYMPNNGAIETVKSKTGATLNILVNKFPPYIDAGNGSRYDPSGAFDDDLWDPGK